MKNSNTGIIIGVAIGAYLLFAPKKDSSGGSGGSLDIPFLPDQSVVGSTVPSPDTGFTPSPYLTDLMSKKSTYDTGLAIVNSDSLFSKSNYVAGNASSDSNALKGSEMNTVLDLLSAPSSSAKKVSAPAKSMSYGAGNSAGSSSTLHARMGVK